MIFHRFLYVYQRGSQTSPSRRRPEGNPRCPSRWRHPCCHQATVRMRRSSSARTWRPTCWRVVYIWSIYIMDCISYIVSQHHIHIYIIISNIIDIIAYGLLYSNHIPSTSRHINGISSPNFLWRPESFPLAGYEWLLLGYTVNSSYNEWTIYMYVINSIWSMKYNMTQLKGYVLNMICVQYTYIYNYIYVWDTMGHIKYT